MTFGERLRELRERREMSQRELSRTADLAFSHVQYLERDAKAPGDETIRRLAKALGVNAKELKTDQVVGHATLLLNEIESPLTDQQREELIDAVDKASGRTRPQGRAGRSSR